MRKLGPEPAQVTVSIVSHGHGALVSSLLADLAKHCGSRIDVVLTLNIPEHPAPGEGAYPFPLKLIRNAAPKGFGANHNAAFAGGNSPFFCVANPDVRLRSDPFPALMKAFNGDRVAVAGPLVRAPDGRVDDCARRYPTPSRLFRKLFVPPQGPDYSTDGGLTEVDWVGGMFMLCDSRAFREVGGFDEGYSLYYEDVDLCARLRVAGMRVVLEPGAEITHHAQRASHRKPRYAWRHAMSILRYLRSSAYRELGRRGMR